MKKIVFVMMSLVCLCTGCGDDADDYVSVLPSFSDITFDTDQLYTGMTVTATAVQATKGVLLDRTTYDWTVDDTTSTSVRVVYDNDNGDPVFKFKVPKVAVKKPSSITVRFEGRYNVSGQGCRAAESEHAAGLSVQSIPSPITGTVILSKTFTVYPSAD